MTFGRIENLPDRESEYHKSGGSCGRTPAFRSTTPKKKVALTLWWFRHNINAMAGTLNLRILNVYGDFVNENVDIFLRHQTLHDDRRVRNAPAAGELKIPGLNENPQGLYRIEIDAPSYVPV